MEEVKAGTLLDCIDGSHIVRAVVARAGMRLVSVKIRNATRGGHGA